MVSLCAVTVSTSFNVSTSSTVFTVFKNRCLGHYSKDVRKQYSKVLINTIDNKEHTIHYEHILKSTHTQ